MEEKKKFTYQEQLVILRDLYQRTGALHEAQVLQLKLWPFAVDPKLDKSKADVDLDNKVVTFTWVGKKSKKDKKYNYRLEELYKHLRFMLGDDWIMRIHLNGSLIFPLDTKHVKPIRNNRIRKSSNRKKSTRASQRRSRAKVAK